MKALLIIAVLTVFEFVGGAHASDFPSHPVKLIVPVAAGGPTDTIARILAQRMSVSLGRKVLVENLTGAAGTIGVGKVASAPPDGYTIGIGHTSTHVINGAIYHLPYNVLTDFAPISLIATTPHLIVAKPSVPATTLKQFVHWLKANPGMALEGTGGAGSPPHIAGLYLQKLTHTRFQFVPYRGAAPAMRDLIAENIDFFIPQAYALSVVRSGKIKAYAVAARERLKSAPDLPTTDEAGVPGFYFSTWHGLWAPKGTPAPVIAKLNAAVVDALADVSVKQSLAKLEQQIFPRTQQTPEALYAYQKAEIEKWWPIIKAAKIAAQ